MRMSNRPEFNYDPKKLQRELAKHYITASEAELSDMLAELKLTDFSEVFSHIPNEIKFKNEMKLENAMDYEALADYIWNISKKNNIKTSFIGDGLKNYKVPEVVGPICQIRNLTTAYTPYQPERSQGTLMTLWLYSSSLSMLTGFEAINASLYERSTCLYEALNCALRLKRKTDTVLVSEGIYPGDLEVIHTLSFATELKIVTVPLSSETGCLDQDKLLTLLQEHKENLAGFAFPQINNLGILENVDLYTDLCQQYGIQAIGLFDPILLATKGLKPPAQWGSEKQGANIIVGEGQHLCLGPNFGGPGLGIFGVRHNDKVKTAIRSTPGRFIGAAKDIDGKESKLIVLSTREQHIRREKATSNICSNQGFVATIAGAAMLNRGDEGMSQACLAGRKNAEQAIEKLTAFTSVELAFPHSPFYNEFTIKTSKKASELIRRANEQGLHLGIDVSDRVKSSEENLILLSFFDIHEQKDIDQLVDFFKTEFGEANTTAQKAPEIPLSYLREDVVGLPKFETKELIDYYQKLGQQNVSPDDNIYPLGSCTMKYNPYINDWAAGLEGFTQTHPQAPEEDCQGALEVHYQIQEYFKEITGLPGVVTQPVAGAQGELVGLKMFQAYHADKGELESRNIILIPRSAHGTNPATATTAGFVTKSVGGEKYGIILVEANENGEVDMEQFEGLVAQYKTRIAGMMVTNPNTSGIFETQFKKMAELIHSVDGLVYMDGANMNAIAGWVDLNEMGVDAVHNNLHKTWSIPHGGGGPGDAIVGVSERLLPYIPGTQVRKTANGFESYKTEKSIGSFHRHHGNFAHKVRAYTYLRALGKDGIKKMSAVAVLSAQYLYAKLKKTYPSLPKGAEQRPRMHEFILSFKDEDFQNLAKAGVPKAQAIAKIGKLYLDYGIHAPTVAFPEPFGLMIEPTESYTKKELDRFCDVVNQMYGLIKEHPEVLTTAPHFTPIKKVLDVEANKNLVLFEKLGEKLPEIFPNRRDPEEMAKLSINEISQAIVKEHESLSR